MFLKALTDEDKAALSQLSKKCKGDILTMTTLAKSGHPGGSMSSIDILLTLYKLGRLSPEDFKSGKGDNMVISIGHISPAVYSCLAANGFFPIDDAISQFRLAGSIYEGHIERMVPGIEWTTGNLGQGLSAACGMALAAKVKRLDNTVYVLMGDGENQKGQISEAKRFAAKYKLNNLIAFIDYNNLQICGKREDVMPQNIDAEYAAAGWSVYHIDGHNFEEITEAVNLAKTNSNPSVIISRTVMGKDVSFMENLCKYHGSPLPEADYEKAMLELGLKHDLDKYKKLRSEFKPNLSQHKITPQTLNIEKTQPILYKSDASLDCRSAYGAAVTSIVEKSMSEGKTPVVIFDCDLAGSVKTSDVAKKFPERFFQAGISEHNAASMAGSISSKGVIPFFSTFTMFAVDEVYNQLRMNDINNSNLKVVSTHSGVDVGEDGRTHQCIDYIGLIRNLIGFKAICPADPNQTDHAVRFAANSYGNVLVAMGRSKVPVITKEDGTPFFDEKYELKYGNIDTIRTGKYPLVAFGGMLYRALQVKEILKDRVDVGVYNASTPAHIDKKQIIKIAEAGLIFVYEDHMPNSGLYSTICEIIASNGIACKVVPFGITQYAYSGTPDDILKFLQLDPESVAAKIRSLI